MPHLIDRVNYLPTKEDIEHLKIQMVTYLSSKEDIENLKLQNGRILAEINKTNTDKILKNIHLAEFKIFSQFGDDGIIQFLVNYLDIDTHTFIEFGVENYKESNTRFLLINCNWKGLIMDGSKVNVDQIKNEEIYWKYDVTAVPVFITRENINEIIESHNFNGEIGLLHIDIDGNDYWIWKEIKNISPIIVVIEYNSVLGDEEAWTIDYDPDFYRTKAHFSNLYFGSSLLALCDLAEIKGYYFIGCNSNGNNAYFIRKDKISNLTSLTAKQGFISSKFRESRNEDGNLSYISGENRYEVIRGMKMYNTRTNKIDIL
jgi:hypothetical protein